MKGNAQLDHNRAQQLTAALQYLVSKRTSVYTEAVYQWTGGDVPGEYDAWISGASSSSNNRQFIARIGLQTTF